MTALAPGEHPTLPRLYAEIRPATIDQTNRSGRVITAGHPAHVRVMFTPTGVLTTASPRRLEAIAAELLDLADALRRTQTGPATPDPTTPTLFDLNQGAS